MALIAHYLKRQGVLAAIEEQVDFACRRFGHYEPGLTRAVEQASSGDKRVSGEQILLKAC